jgi:hypothetical protein
MEKKLSKFVFVNENPEKEFKQRLVAVRPREEGSYRYMFMPFFEKVGLVITENGFEGLNLEGKLVWME